MELEELKQSWKETAFKNKLNMDIMQIIQNKTYGPVAEMKKTFKRQMIAMAVLPVCLLLTNISNIYAPLTSVMFWAYVAFCAGTIAFAYRNYRITIEMSQMDKVVKTSLEQQVNILEQRSLWQLTALRFTLLFFIALTEILPYFQHYSMLQHWHGLSPLIRFSGYAALFAMQYFLTPRIRERKLGRHLRYLKTLVKDMEG